MLATKHAWEAGSSQEDAIGKGLALITERRLSKDARGLRVRLDYLRFHNAETFEVLANDATAAIAGDVVILSGALWVNRVRLIDNLVVGDSKLVLRGNDHHHLPLSAPGSSEPLVTLRAVFSQVDVHAFMGDAPTGFPSKASTSIQLRERNVTANVSGPREGVHQRIVTVTGTVHAVSNAYALITSQIPPRHLASSSKYPPASFNRLRLLVPEILVSRVMGRAGNTIKAIQAVSGAYMHVRTVFQPHSTERIVDIRGSPETIGAAVKGIGEAVVEASGPKDDNWEPVLAKDVHLTPRIRAQPRLRTAQTIFIPSDSRSSLLGANGTNIEAIQLSSGSRIRVNWVNVGVKAGQLKVVIFGTTQAIERAVCMVHEHVYSARL